MYNVPAPIFLWHPESECLWITYDRREANQDMDADGCVQEVTYKEYLKIKKEHDL